MSVASRRAARSQSSRRLPARPSGVALQNTGGTGGAWVASDCLVHAAQVRKVGEPINGTGWAAVVGLTVHRQECCDTR